MRGTLDDPIVEGSWCADSVRFVLLYNGSVPFEYSVRPFERLASWALLRDCESESELEDDESGELHDIEWQGTAAHCFPSLSLSPRARPPLRRQKRRKNTKGGAWRRRRRAASWSWRLCARRRRRAARATRPATCGTWRRCRSRAQPATATTPRVGSPSSNSPCPTLAQRRALRREVSRFHNSVFCLEKEHSCRSS